jgi:hypothetical protein
VLGRRPWAIGAVAALVAVGAAIGIVAGHGAAPTRTATLPVPPVSAAPRPLVVLVPRTTAVPLPALRATRKQPKKTSTSHATTKAPSGTPSSPPSPGYTIVGG